MINKIFFLFILILLVFIQVFFIDNFNFKFGLIFIPFLIYLFKNDNQSVFLYSIIIFIFYDFFKNNFVGIPLVIFLVFNSLLNQMSKIWDKVILQIIRLIGIYLIFNIFSYGVLNISFLINFIIFGLIILLRGAYKSGYFRLN